MKLRNALTPPAAKPKPKMKSHNVDMTVEERDVLVLAAHLTNRSIRGFLHEVVMRAARQVVAEASPAERRAVRRPKVSGPKPR